MLETTEHSFQDIYIPVLKDQISHVSEVGLDLGFREALQSGKKRERTVKPNLSFLNFPCLFVSLPQPVPKFKIQTQPESISPFQMRWAFAHIRSATINLYRFCLFEVRSFLVVETGRKKQGKENSISSLN